MNKITAQVFYDKLFVFDNERLLFGWKNSQCNEIKNELNIIEGIGTRVPKRPKLKP